MAMGRDMEFNVEMTSCLWGYQGTPSSTATKDTAKAALQHKEKLMLNQSSPSFRKLDDEIMKFLEYEYLLHLMMLP